MKLLSKEIHISNYVPPIITSAYRKYKYKAHNKGLKPFVHECLNSYSQYHEYLILDLIFEQKKAGFYCDIGANDPVVFNNTKRFYDRGWRGINVEPNVALYAKIVEDRPRDINLNIGIGETAGEMTFYIMSADALSTFDRQIAMNSSEKVIAERTVHVEPLASVFQEYLTTDLDFLSVDAEGYDLQVLRSNDWRIFRPRVLMVETNTNGLNVVSFLKRVDYTLIFSNGTNGIFVEKCMFGSTKTDID